MYLGEFKELVLLMVANFNGGAYGLSIAEELKQCTDRSINLSGIHVALYRLEEKGFVTSDLGGATTARRGRRKRLFSITAYGKRTLDELRQVRNDLWRSIPNLAVS
ncbi:hypothetical protein GCM10028809_14650 [Spirosoma gilvum]